MTEKIQQIKNLINIKEVNGNYKCKCPYHNDPSDDGSLIIVPEDNQIHCFGCGKDGTIEDLLGKLKERV